MKRLVLLTEDGKKHFACELWNSNGDSEIFEILGEIETEEKLSYELLEKAYNHFNAISEIDSPFELIREDEDEVVISWTEEDWEVRFRLE